MKLPQTLVAIAATGALTLTACGGGTTIGPGGVGSIDPRASESPTPTKKAKPTKKATATPKQTATKQAPGAVAKKRAVSAVQNFQFDPTEFQARNGDPVTFTNVATDSEHSFVVEDAGIDSGALKTGETFTFKVDLAPGEYLFRCGVVPYMVSGRMVVFA